MSKGSYYGRRGQANAGRQKSADLTREALKRPGASAGQFGPRPVKGATPRRLTRSETT